MLASVVNFFNPSLDRHRRRRRQQPGPVLLAAIRETVYRRSLPLATRDLLIQRSSLGGLAGVIGASAMVVDQLFVARADRPLDRGGRARPAWPTSPSSAADSTVRRPGSVAGHDGR